MQSQKGKENTVGDQAISTAPRSAPLASQGVRTGTDFANLMSALMSDVIEGRVTPQVANAACNAGGKLLKVVEMQYQYGTTGDGSPKTILLAPGDDSKSE